MIYAGLIVLGPVLVLIAIWHFSFEWRCDRADKALEKARAEGRSFYREVRCLGGLSLYVYYKYQPRPREDETGGY